LTLLRCAEVNVPSEAEVVVEEPENERPYDGKFVAWDLECTGNSKEDGVHVCYAMSLAWKHQYASFWGLGSAIKQGLGLRGWEFCTICQFFAIFSNFTKIPQVPSFQAHSRENRFPPKLEKRPKIAKHTKHEPLPKRDAIFLKFP
jgi:hypothetical protein